jgi:hypothetical protein
MTFHVKMIGTQQVAIRSFQVLQIERPGTNLTLTIPRRVTKAEQGVTDGSPPPCAETNF